MTTSPKMNRHQRRRFAVNFRKARIESYPRLVPPKPGESPCDWPGCTAEWQFVTMVGAGKDRKPAARRCAEHRLG